MYRPRQPLTFRAELGVSRPVRISAQLSATRPGGPTWESRHNFLLQAGINTVELVAGNAGAAGHSYVVDLVVEDDRHGRLTAVSAADVLRSWRDDPRYGFLS